MTIKPQKYKNISRPHSLLVWHIPKFSF